ncbi:MAG TPA: nitroreductase family protein [Gaiellaceae bacterium]
MEFRDLLKRRRMVRHYDGEPIPREALERIVSTVRRAPSGGFSQGQRLLVVDEPSLLARMAEGEEDWAEGMEPWLGSAPAQILVMTREADYHDRYQKEDKLEDGEEIVWPVPFWHVDAGAALMLVLLAAIDEGLAAGVYGIFGDTDALYRELFRIPDDFVIVAGVTLGHPLPDPAWSKSTSRATQRRRTVDELVHWNAW